MKLPVLVDCEPYRVRLTEASCVDRWQKAQTISSDGKGLGQGAAAIRNGIRRSVLAECRTLPVGKQRAEQAA